MFKVNNKNTRKKMFLLLTLTIFHTSFIADFEQENVNWELINSANFKNRNYTEIEKTDSSYETETITK